MSWHNEHVTQLQPLKQPGFPAVKNSFRHPRPLEESNRVIHRYQPVEKKSAFFESSTGGRAQQGPG